MSRDSTGAPSIRQSKAKKTHQEVGDRLRSAECDHPSAGSNGGLCNPQLFFTEHHTKGHFPEQTENLLICN